MTKISNSNGFTLTETLITIGLFSIIFAIVFVSLVQPKASADINSAEDLIYVTVKEAQNLAMKGPASSFGVHFEQNKFVFFQGATYTPGDSSNLETILEPNLSIESISLPTGTSIIFSQLSGEVQGLSLGTSGSFVLRETNTNETKTFTITSLGAVDVNE
jgi:prepilin-type N-terminal cleavage/methylation domain-containing protein